MPGDRPIHSRTVNPSTLAMKLANARTRRLDQSANLPHTKPLTSEARPWAATKDR